MTCLRSLERVQAAVPLLVAMRRTIKPKRTFTAACYAEISAQLLAKCLAALGTSTSYSYDIAQNTGVSYDELVRQCLEATDNSFEQVSCAHNQLFLITRLEISVARDTSRMNRLLDSLIKRHFVTFATRTMFNMQASTDTRIRHNADRHRDFEHLDVQDTCLPVLLGLFQRAQSKDTETAIPAIEAIESNLLFILENHSHSAVEFAREGLDQIGLFCCSFVPNHRAYAKVYRHHRKNCVLGVLLTLGVQQTIATQSLRSAPGHCRSDSSAGSKASCVPTLEEYVHCGGFYMASHLQKLPP